MCSARIKGSRRCKRCQCIDYLHSLKKCDACMKLIRNPDACNEHGEYLEERAGPEFFGTNSTTASSTYCKVCSHFKKKAENRETQKGRSKRLQDERSSNVWPGLVQMRHTQPKYVEEVEAQFQKFHETPGTTTDQKLLMMARLGIYVSNEMKLRVCYKWKKRCGHVR